MFDQLKLKNGQWDWWKVFGGLLVIGGIETLMSNFVFDEFWRGVFVGGINILAGVAVWKESVPVFKLVRVLFLVGIFFAVLGALTGVWGEIVDTTAVVEGTYWSNNLMSNFVTLLNLLTLVAMVMLWRRLKQEKKIKW